MILYLAFLAVKIMACGSFCTAVQTGMSDHESVGVPKTVRFYISQARFGARKSSGGAPFSVAKLLLAHRGMKLSVL